ncbi:helix-turn-helix domain-containing protein [Rhizobium sp. L1K21]|uniref:winged helix-turn-helix transcriptional regulator n=1 Tax=Rhizobium sp. L1K21 TaxID=2954933 RepID=UPI002093D68F|nr:helix-turn-helix domain-containing protein [Rhizobium sp. L1K21]MCO6187586.1 helix-turn-helix transcriptional regulator [Rhizobium sp. L1K21]
MATKLDTDRWISLLSVGEASKIEADDPRLTGLVRLAKTMGDPPPARDAPQREVLARLGDNWSALIIKVLATGTFRHSTLKRVISDLSSEKKISQRMLTLRLRALERDGFVARKEYHSNVPTVVYSLTPLGYELSAELDHIIGWIEDRMDQILAARATFRD